VGRSVSQSVAATNGPTLRLHLFDAWTRSRQRFGPWQARACPFEGDALNDWNEDPINGCRMGSKCPILHAKWAKLCPIAFSYALRSVPWPPRRG
jgi:hypothetical protein